MKLTFPSMNSWCRIEVSSSQCNVIKQPGLSKARVLKDLNLACFEPESVHFSCSVGSNSFRPHGLQHSRAPCPSPTPKACSNSCPLSWWCHSTISCSVIPFSSCLQSFPASGSFPVSQFFVSGGQSIGLSVSGSVIPMNIQDWCPLRWTDWISL